MDFREKAEKNRILEIRVGSHLFGTDTEESDLDLYGIFMPFDEIIFGSYNCEEVKFDKISKDESGRNTKDAVDRTLSEYRKFIRLALQNNPNILHILFANSKNIVFSNEFGSNLLSMAKKFPHKGAHHRFVKYAESQLYKMRIKPEKYKLLQEGLKFLREDCGDGDVMADVVSRTIIFKTEGKHVRCGDILIERGVFVKKAKKIISERLDKFTSRKEMYSRIGYDCKYASNLIQLLKEGIELMKTGEIIFPLVYRDEILDIKKGKYSAMEIEQWAEQLIEEARMEYERSELPANPRAKEIEKFAMEQVKEFVLNN